MRLRIQGGQQAAGDVGVIDEFSLKMLRLR